MKLQDYSISCKLTYKPKGSPVGTRRELANITDLDSDIYAICLDSDGTMKIMDECIIKYNNVVIFMQSFYLQSIGYGYPSVKLVEGLTLRSILKQLVPYFMEMSEEHKIALEAFLHVAQKYS